MSQEFYLANEKHPTIDGKIVENKNVLYFKQERSQFDGKATKEHVQQYPKEYALFKEKYPDFKLPWGDEADFVGVQALKVGETSHEEVKPDGEVSKVEEDSKGVFHESIPDPAKVEENKPNELTPAN